MQLIQLQDIKKRTIISKDKIMFDVYSPCVCNSGKKYKFCCSKNPNLTIFPVVECAMGEGWEEKGITPVTVVRAMPNDRFLLGVYLVDFWFLGVKDAFLKKKLTAKEINDFYAEAEEYDDVFKKIPYEEARSVILGSIAYAAQFDIKPHQDWQEARAMIEPERAFDNKFTFGKDGKPHYVAGPYDNARLKEYMQKACNAGGSFAIPTSDPDRWITSDDE